MADMKILIVEDDEDIAELLSLTFSKEGWQSRIAGSGEEAMKAISEEAFSACVLDLMLPGMDGLAVLRGIRKSREGEELPVIIASARGEDSDVMAGLELGADDYVAKPFSPRVLAARMRAVLRRVAPSGPAKASAALCRLERAGIALDPVKHEVKVSGKIVPLSATEFALLEFLMREPGRVFTRAQTIAGIRGHDYAVTDRAVDVQVLGLRRKLGEAGEAGEASQAIETVRGIGYRFRDTE